MRWFEHGRRPAAAAAVTALVGLHCGPVKAAADSTGDAAPAYALACSIRTTTDLPNVRHCAETGAAQRCHHEAELASHESQDRVEMLFDNHSDQPVLLYWLTFAGGRRLYRTVAPGGHWSQQTFLGHNWLVTTQEGRCVGIYNAAAISLAFY